MSYPDSPSHAGSCPAPGGGWSLGSLILQVCALLSWSGAVAAHAEERTEVIGSRLSVAAHDAVTVIDRSRIERFGAWSVAGILRYVPGLDVVRSGGLAGQTSLFLRGGNANHVRVLLDGVWINDPISGLADLSMLPADEVESIEIARGPQGVAHGAGAMGGVIHIHTRRGARRGLRLTLDAAAGSFRSRSQTARMFAAGSAAALELQLGRWRAAGFSIAAPAPGRQAGEEDGYRATAANLRLRYRRGPGAQAELGLRRQRNRQEIEGFDAATFQLIDDPDSFQRDANWQGYAQLQMMLRPGWRQRLRAGLFRLRRIAENGPLAGGACCSSDRRGIRRELLWAHDLRTPIGRLLLGMDVREERVEDRQTASRYALDHKSVWLETFLWSERLRAGLRREEHDAHGGHTAWDIRLSGPAGGRWRLHAGVGSAWRPPGIGELYPREGGVLSDPPLLPERSLGWQLGVAYQADAGHMGMSLYRQGYQDLLEYDPASRQVRNIGRASVRGLELSLAGNPLRTLQLQFDYSLTRARNRRTGRPLLRRPLHKFSAVAGLSRPAHGLDLNLALRHVGSRADFGRMLPSYTVGDLICRWRIWPAVRLRFGIENLTGRRYQEISGYQAPGRAFHAGVRITPGFE